MKYQSSNTKTIFDINFDKVMSICPECSQTRKKKTDKALKFYKDTNTAYCHHCNTTFFEYKKYETKEYIVPKWENKTNLTDRAVKYFTSRMISQDTLVKMGVYSATEWMPQHGKEIECICFPYFKGDKVLNIKYRAAKKAFKLYSGAELLFYNYNALNNDSIIICEGEIDALSWIECGFDNVISVPNGASVKTMEYLDSSIDMFDKIQNIYLSTDSDTVGIELRDEFIRRLGADKCHTLSFKEFKDANDYFCKYGGDGLREVFKNAKPIPIKGMIECSSLRSDILDLYENGETKGLDLEVPEMDKFVTWELGRLATVTGIPGSGKSELVDFIVTKLNMKYGWKAAFFTPENYPLKYHYRKLHTKYSGKKFEKETDTSDFDTIYEHINDNYYYIMDQDDMTVGGVIKSATMLVKQKGIKILVIDPYNKLEHDIKSNQSETQYISKFLDVLTNFARFNNVLIFLVAHPKKVNKGELITLYDIAGSANFYNKTDYGFTVEREKNIETGLMTAEVNVYWQKIKFRHLGEQGKSELVFNVNNGRYEQREGKFDNNSWIGKDTEIQVIPEMNIAELEDHFNTESRELAPF